MTIPRKPRLTNNLLGDLEIAVDELTAAVAFLASVKPSHLPGMATPSYLRVCANAADRHERLTRARDWLQRHVDAVRAGRNLAGHEVDAGGEPADGP